MGCKCNIRTSVAVVFLICGVCFVVGGCVLWFGGIFQHIINNKVNENIELKDGTLVYKQWKEPTSPIYMQYFVFDVTNPDDVQKNGAKPNVTQKGPYSYKEIRTNEVLNYSADGTVVTFMPNRSYVFDPETSCNRCDPVVDTFTTVNIPLLTVALWLKDTNYVKNNKDCFNALVFGIGLLGAKLFQAKTVHEMLWGYDDPVINLIKNPPSFLPFLKKCPKKPGLNPFIQLQYNNTYYGISAINTGTKEINKLEQYTMWRNEKQLNWWESKYANMINGTDGTQYKPRISKSDVLYNFVPEICRSIYAVYDSEVTVRKIKLYRFTAPKEVYLTGDIYPPNMGFCVPRNSCLPTGLLNVTRCQPQNPPVVISPPHFYLSNISLVDAIHGLNPTKEEHGTFIDIEPTTGITMQANKRIQVNVALQSVDSLSQTIGKFDLTFLPVMYVNESAKISEEDAKTFIHQVYDPIELTQGVEYGLLGLGGLFIILAIVLFACEAAARGSSSSDGYEKQDNVVT